MKLAPGCWLKNTTHKPGCKQVLLFQVIGKVVGAPSCLYFFICSLDFLSTAIRLLGGKHATAVFAQSDLLQNPMVGLMLGVLVTVLLQSSSTTTSIIVGMVGGQIITVR